jgi:hypothetical protein
VIHVEPQPEPADFDEKVRKPGLAELVSGKTLEPVWKQGLWRRALPDLWRAYGGVCAYLVIYIPRAVGSKSVDHFLPKSKQPKLAFEWSNFRLACSLMNSRKNAVEDVLDPFQVEDGWFILELSSLEVLPAPDLTPDLQSRVVATIERLRLNDAECRQARAGHHDQYFGPEAEVTWAGLCKFNPFLARELVRQGIVDLDGQRK